MQIKPAFTYYKEFWREEYATDHRGDVFDLVCFTGIRRGGYHRCEEREYRVLSRSLTTYSNGTTGYSDNLFFNAKKSSNFALTDGKQPKRIRGIDIFPVWVGVTDYLLVCLRL